MSLVIRLANIISPNDFVVSYKTGATLGDITTGFTYYGTTYSGGTTEVIVSGVTLYYQTQYWFRITDIVTNRHVARNIYTHDENYFLYMFTSPTPTPSITPTITPTLPVQCIFSGGSAGYISIITPTPTITPTITESPIVTPSITPTVTLSILADCTFTGGSAGYISIVTPTPSITSTPAVNSTPSITSTPAVTSTPLNNCIFSGGTAILV